MPRLYYEYTILYHIILYHTVLYYNYFTPTTPTPRANPRPKLYYIIPNYTICTALQLLKPSTPLPPTPHPPGQAQGQAERGGGGGGSGGQARGRAEGRVLYSIILYGSVLYSIV
jgi:hypothetical protein